MTETPWPAVVALAEPKPGDFCCVPVSGGLGKAIEYGQYFAQTLEGLPARLQAYDHAEVYVGMPDEAGPYGYTYSAYPDDGSGTVTGKRPLPCPAAQLPGSIWSSGIIELTPLQRAGIIGWCAAHPDVSYSWADYGALAMHALHIPAPGLKAYIASTKSMICSWYSDASFDANGIHLFTDGRWPGYVTPGALAFMLEERAGL